MTGSNGNGSNGNEAQVGTLRVKQGLAQMLKGGVIVSVDFLVLHGDGLLGETECFGVGRLSALFLCRSLIHSRN
jgi:hypothetical protein